MILSVLLHTLYSEKKSSSSWFISAPPLPSPQYSFRVLPDCGLEGGPLVSSGALLGWSWTQTLPQSPFKGASVRGRDPEWSSPALWPACLGRWRFPWASPQSKSSSCLQTPHRCQDEIPTAHIGSPSVPFRDLQMVRILAPQHSVSSFTWLLVLEPHTPSPPDSRRDLQFPCIWNVRPHLCIPLSRVPSCLLLPSHPPASLTYKTQLKQHLSLQAFPPCPLSSSSPS